MNFDGLKRLYRHYFSFTRSERKGLILLCSILFLLITLNYTIGFFEKETHSDFSEVKELMALYEKSKMNESPNHGKSLFVFDPNQINRESFDTLSFPSKIKGNILKYRENGGIFYKATDLKKIYGMNDSLFTQIEPFIKISTQQKVKAPKINTEKTIEYFEFDPNTCSERTLSRLGFSSFQIQNLKKYISQGGCLYKKEDLLKIYGVDSVLYSKLEKWITIKEVPKALVVNNTIIELNSADSISLVKLKGIGPVLSSRIIKYRNLLGGYYSKNQLLEVYGLKSETFNLVENHISIDVDKIKKIRINFADIRMLQKHPYISNVLSKTIIDEREQNGYYKSMDQLKKRVALRTGIEDKVLYYLRIE